MNIDVDEFKALLLARLVDLQAVAKSAEDDARPVELDQTSVGRLSRMDALQVQAMAQETERRRRVELARIDRALAMIEQGEYGYCANCGDEIPEGRLLADPATPHCVACVQKTGS